MHKFPLPLAHEIPPETSGSKLVRTAAIVILGIALVPPVAEGLSICYGQWCEVLGRNTEVHTPVLDSVQDNVHDVHRSAWGWMSAQFQRLPWQPRFVLPVATAIMLIGMIMLRL
jgi:hypothetical protein